MAFEQKMWEMWKCHLCGVHIMYNLPFCVGVVRNLPSFASKYHIMWYKQATLTVLVFCANGK